MLKRRLVGVGVTIHSGMVIGQALTSRRCGPRVAARRLERGLEQEVEVPARAARVEHGLARALAARDELGGLGEVAGEERGVEAAARGGGEGERGGGGARVQAARVHGPPPLYPRTRLGEIFLFGGAGGWRVRAK